MKFYCFLFLAFIGQDNLNAQAYYNKNGEAVMYYDNDKNAFFTYSGNPVGYLKRDLITKDILVYDFSGNQLGWLSEGKIYNREGKLNSYVKGVSGTTALEPLRQQQKLLPLRQTEQLPGVKPLFSMTFDNDPLFITKQQNDYPSLPSTNVYNPPLDPKVYETKPYNLPVKDITKAFNSLNQQHEEMLRNGYVLDDRTGEYIKREIYEAREKITRGRLSASVNECLEACKNSPVTDYRKLKAGWYIIRGYYDEQGCKDVSVKIDKGKIVRIYENGQSKKLKNPILIFGGYTQFSLETKADFLHSYFGINNGFFFYALGYTAIKSPR